MANHHIQEYGIEAPQVAVVMVPLPAQGHLNQLLHLSRLISAYNVPIYYVGTATHIRQARNRVHGLEHSSIPNIQFQEFPTPPFQNILPNPNASDKFPSQILPSLYASKHLRDPVYTFVNQLSRKFTRVVCIYDSLMAYVVQDLDSIPNSESYCFHSLSAFTIYSFQWENAGRPCVPTEAEILKEIPSSDGCFPSEFSEFANLQRRLRSTKKINSGGIFNSSREIENLYLELLAKENASGAEKQWAVGPFNPVSISEKKDDSHGRDKCLKWLDKQGLKSVIFVSFGTTSLLSDEQIFELAVGLERSEQKFIWVVRDADKGDVFEGDIRRAPLPEKYEERIEGRGVIVRDWAPQLEILAHPSTGGFMSHCGWNSCMESMSMGVPIATWPMHSDQPRNAFLVTNVLRIGVQVKNWDRRDELITSVTVENGVRELMASAVGDEIRKKAAGMAEAVKKSVMEGGATRREMDSFVSHITR